MNRISPPPKSYLRISRCGAKKHPSLLLKILTVLMQRAYRKLLAAALNIPPHTTRCRLRMKFRNSFLHNPSQYGEYCAQPHSQRRNRSLTIKPRVIRTMVEGLMLSCSTTSRLLCAHALYYFGLILHVFTNNTSSIRCLTLNLLLFLLNLNSC